MNLVSSIFFNILFKKELFELYKQNSNLPFRVTINKKYKLIEYDIKLNLLTFCNLYLPLKITIIGFPISICEKGYDGDLNDITKDLRKRKGIFLFLNDDTCYEQQPYRSGRTLPNCIFYNNFKKFDEYLSSLRSQYRRRINIALNKGKKLKITKIKNENFTDEIHNLYLNVLKNSKYPLETLDKGFFQDFESEIYVFYKENKPVAFVQLKEINETLNFIFGGMDYQYRDEYDLYYNMLLFILKTGIERQCKIINFGQTAEQSKMRIGCTLQSKYMHIYSSNKIMDYILIKLIRYLEYKETKQNLRVFKYER